MNTYAVVFAAFIIAVQGGSIRVARQVDGGWGAPLPEPVLIDIELDAEAAAIGGGVAEASQDTFASAIGTEDHPAEIALATVVEAELDQVANADQVAIADLLNLSSIGINQVVAGNIASATDNLFANVLGGQSAVLANSGSGNVAGAGASSVNGASSNVISS
ncbi:unnamed protein product [Orchesella dallaii]|uniref:Uncharacterized protein n=1 Tax=Orchesella dallaii TaxID=48710 RepID=A0ABP1RH90_9HEXA